MLCRLPEASSEEWNFESPSVEGPEHWKTTLVNTPYLDRLIGNQTSGRKRGPVKKKRDGDNTVLRHLMVASDPINAVSGGSNWRAETALKEYVSRTRCISDQTLSELYLDNPISEKGRIAFSELCTSIGVGLIIQVEGIHIVKICDSKNIWLEQISGADWGTVPWCKAPVGASTVQSLMAHKGRELAKKKDTSMRELRNIAQACGIPRPLPRSKQSLAEFILKEVDDKAA